MSSVASKVFGFGAGEFKKKDTSTTPPVALVAVSLLNGSVVEVQRAALFRQR